MAANALVLWSVGLDVDPAMRRHGAAWMHFVLSVWQGFLDRLSNWLQDSRPCLEELPAMVSG